MHKPNFKYRLLLILVILALCLGYRTVLWRDFSTHWPDIVTNSLLDTIFGVTCGILIFRIYKKTKPAVYYPLGIVLLTTFSIGLFYSHMLIYVLVNQYSESFASFFTAICFQFLDSGSIVVLSSLAVFIQNQLEIQNISQRKLMMLEKEKAKVELKYLKSQIDPHFVFNSLNMIYHEMDDQNISAKESLLEFADILRYHLQYVESADYTLEKEIEYIKSYIRFQKKRCQDHLEINEDIVFTPAKMNIEPLLILPLVENAFKYCNHHAEEKGKITFQLRNTATHLEFSVENTIKQFSGNVFKDGHGLDNLKRRLSLIYPGKFQLIPVINKLNNLYQCKLEIWV